MSKTSAPHNKTVKLDTTRVAIVHDWLYGGGAELVVEQLHKLFPEAPIYTSYCSDTWRARLDGKVVTGWLQYLGNGRLRKFVPFLRIWWFSRLDLTNYDLVISSSGAEAKGVRVPDDALHVNYCHAPTHYYWSRYDEYMEHPGFGALDWLARLGLRLFAAPLRRWDYRAAQRPDYIIANSTHIQRDIKKYYGRDSTVVFPPVYFERFQKHDALAASGKKSKTFVISGRQVAYKRFDLAIEACKQRCLPLTVIGTGPDHDRLRSLAGPTVRFLGGAADEVLEREFATAGALIFPGTDDFGITPVEALASGTPVIAFEAGGALDYIVPGITGEFFEQQTVESLCATLSTFDPGAYDSEEIKRFASRFSKETFQTEMIDFLTKSIQS